MTWSYDATFAEKGLNFVRLMIGDTDTDDQQLSDEEIGTFLAMESNQYTAAALASDAISAKYRRLGANNEAREYAQLAILLRFKAGADYL